MVALSSGGDLPSPSIHRGYLYQYSVQSLHIVHGTLPPTQSVVLWPYPLPPLLAFSFFVFCPQGSRTPNPCLGVIPILLTRLRSINIYYPVLLYWSSCLFSFLKNHTNANPPRFVGYSLRRLCHPAEVPLMINHATVVD